MRLDLNEFMRRFLQHVLPRGFVRIRHGGFMGNRHRGAKLTWCRLILGVRMDSDEVPGVDWKTLLEQLTGRALDLCPACKQGRMEPVEVIERLPLPRGWPWSERLDSS